MEELRLEGPDPVDVARTLEREHDADIADALNAIDPSAAARVLAALPFDLAVRTLNQPQLDDRARLFEHLSTDRAAALVAAMSSDQRAEVFRGLSNRARARLLAGLDAPTRESLRSLLGYPPTTAGGIMTTEHVEAPANWTVERTLAHLRAAGHPQRPVYAVYVLDPRDRRLVHVVTLRELVLADPGRTLLELGDRRPPVTVGPYTDREEAARLIAKYDLLAVPVIVASLLSLTVPELTKLLLMAPWKKNEPVLVIGPLKKVLAVTATMLALLSPPLNVAPATELVSTPEPLTTIRPLEYVFPFKSNVPPLMLAVPLTTALPNA